MKRSLVKSIVQLLAFSAVNASRTPAITESSNLACYRNVTVDEPTFLPQTSIQASFTGDNLNTVPVEATGKLSMFQKIIKNHLVEVMLSIGIITTIYTIKNKIVQALFGIRVNQRDNDGMTALARAARDGDTATVKTLLATPGILVNGGDNPNTAPLRLAAFRGHTTIVQALLAAPGILVNERCRSGLTALAFAASAGHTAIVQALLASPDIQVNGGGRPGTAPLMLATFNGHTATVQALLIAPGIDVHEVGADEQTTAIVEAFNQGYGEIVRLLEARGAVLPAHLRENRNRHNHHNRPNVNEDQSAHLVSVHISVSRSARNLARLYPYTLEQITNVINNLSNWLDIGFSNPAELPAEYKPMWLQPAKNCVERLPTLDFIDQRSGVSMKQALAFTWEGINNTQAHGPGTPVLSDQEIADRRINYLKGLYEIQRAYNLSDGANPVDDGAEDRPTCVSGSFNKLMASLSEVGHEGVQIVVLTKAIIVESIPFLTKQAFHSLSNEDKQKYAQAWEDENSEDIQTECFEALQKRVHSMLHEMYNEFDAELPNLNQILGEALANVKYTEMDEVMKSEREAIQKKESEHEASLQPILTFSHQAGGGMGSLEPTAEPRLEAPVYRPAM